MTEYIIDLPYPDKALWPNGRAHWASKARETKKHRDWAMLATLDAKVPKGAQIASIRIMCYPKRTGPLPDRDNVTAACKAMLDGIADALGVNDRDFPAPIVEFGEREGRFAVVLQTDG